MKIDHTTIVHLTTHLLKCVIVEFLIIVFCFTFLVDFCLALILSLYRFPNWFWAPIATFKQEIRIWCTKMAIPYVYILFHRKKKDSSNDVFLLACSNFTQL